MVSGTRSIAARRSSAHRRDHDRLALAGVPRDLSANGVGLEVLREAEAYVDEFAVAAGDRHVVGTQIGVRLDERLLEVLRERCAAADAAPAASRGCSAAGARCGRWRNSHARSSPCRFHACGIRKPRADRWDRGHAPRPGPRARRPRPGTPRDSDDNRCPATGHGRQSRRPTRPRTPAPTSPGRRGRRSRAPRRASSHNSRTASVATGGAFSAIVAVGAAVSASAKAANLSADRDMARGGSVARLEAVLAEPFVLADLALEDRADGFAIGPVGMVRVEAVDAPLDAPGQPDDAKRRSDIVDDGSLFSCRSSWRAQHKSGAGCSRGHWIGSRFRARDRNRRSRVASSRTRAAFAQTGR